jgi:glycosyltransferase involved in cell wall biosynthesis
MIKKVPIEITIIALNEEANIQSILKSVAEQEQSIYRIERILLLSDGSTDETVQRAKALEIPQLQVIEHDERVGKSARLREICKQVKSDILVTFDADVILGSPHTVEQLVEPIIQQRATLTSGNPRKVRTPRFTDKVMDVSAFLQEQIKQRLDDGRSLYACHGRAIAMHRSIYTRLAEVDFSSVGNDAFIYLFNKKSGSGFEYVKNAVVRYKMPQTFSDFIRQQRRFSSSPQQQVKFFDESILEEYKIPRSLLLQILLRALLKYHMFVVFYVFYQIIARFYKTKDKPQWEVSSSTKKV